MNLPILSTDAKATVHRNTAEVKHAKKPCKHCGGMLRYVSNSACPCSSARLNLSRLGKPYAEENKWLRDWIRQRHGRGVELARGIGIFSSSLQQFANGKNRILPHVRQDLLDEMAAIEAAERGEA